VSIHPFGITAASEGAIYSMIASPSNPLALQTGVLLFDAAGYESFFRGTLQGGLAGRLGGGAPVAAALVDAGIHLVTLNPLWVATTFIVDLGWGLLYRTTGDLTAPATSHFVWDLVIFILLPIR
jgi:CAAX protease family protein